MYKATLNNKLNEKVEISGNDTFKINDKEYTIERFENDPGLITISNGQLQHKVRIHKVDSKNKTFQLRS